MALAALPLCWRVLRGLPDRGYAVSKTIGLLTAGYVAWLLPSLKVMSFGRGAVLIGIALTALLSLAAVWRWRRDFMADLRSRWREIVFVEALFLIAFLVFVWFRTLNPDLWHPYRGGEKPMEFAYFNAVVRSTHFPAYDPWFAGGYINYYYFGYVLMGAVTRLTGVIPSMAFNLAVPTLFAFMVINTWSFVRNALGMLHVKLGKGSRWTLPAIALLGPLFTVFLGNLDLARRIGRGEYGYSIAEEQGWFGLGALSDVIRGTWRAFVHAQPMPTDTFWAPSRVIPDTVNEFPYFTFLFADFHPHMAGLTVTSAILVVSLAVLGSRRWPHRAENPPVEGSREFFTSRRAVFGAVQSIPRGISVERGLMVGLVALMTGMLFPLNAWDFPTYVLLVVGAFALLEVVSVVAEMPTGLRGFWEISYASVRRVAIWSAATVVLGRALFLTYFAAYQQPNSGFDAWEGSKTLTSEYLIIHGIVLFFVVSFLLAEIAWLSKSWSVPIIRYRGARWSAAPDSSPSTRTLSITVDRAPRLVNPVVAIAGLFTLLGIYAIWTDKLFWLLVALAIPTAAVAWERRREPVHLFLCAMVGLALGLSAAVERYALRGDIGRFNTVFKFYLQIWVLFGLVAAVGTALMIVRYRHLLAPLNRAGWCLMGGVLLLAGISYPLLVTHPRLEDRFNELPRTLDGMAYMQIAVYDDARPDGGEIVPYALREDLDGINWLLDNVQGSPVVLEGLTSLYRWGSRISVYTGLPTVIGWDWHQTQQRPGYGNLINERREDVNWIYDSEVDFFMVQPLLDKYHVQYVYVGPLEKVMYGAAGLAKFDRAVESGELSIAFRNGTVTIYKYPSDATR
jgi:YYY domain-containing protein